MPRGILKKQENVLEDWEIFFNETTGGLKIESLETVGVQLPNRSIATGTNGNLPRTDKFGTV